MLVWCPAKPIAKDILHVALDPTQVPGHTPELVGCHGLGVNVRFGDVLGAPVTVKLRRLFLYWQVSGAVFMDTEGLMSAFISTCSVVLDSVAPVKTWHPRPKVVAQ